MNATEAAKLLAILAAVDRREFDTTTAQGWAWALPDATLEHALEAARRAMDTGSYVDVTAIKTQLRAMRPRLEADVRSAKVRGLIPTDWPTSRPLPAPLEQRLRDAQHATWTATNDRPEQIAPPTASPAIDLGIRLRGTA